MGSFGNLFRAEWLKIAGNRWVAGCLKWVFPILIFGFILLMAVILALSGAARESFQEGAAEEPYLWTEYALSTWNLPNNPIGRLVLLGFTAVVFAGEYQWKTWKNTVPRRHRVSLILIKFLALGVFVVVAFVSMSIIFAAGWGVLTEIAGVPYGPALSGDVLTDFAEDYLLQASQAFTSTIIAAGYAALAGMLTRSILGGVLVGVGITFLENLLILILALIGWFLGFYKIVHLYRLTPGYNLLNVNMWVTENHAQRVTMFEDSRHLIVMSDTLAFSLVVLAAWIVGLITLTVVLFQRQDITS
ncbi:MAG: hypothetical protein JW966_16640 [Anaerolineae bacterium]|nr:hypothetical protein [Anaerolineae bacterium]